MSDPTEPTAANLIGLFPHGTRTARLVVRRDTWVDLLIRDVHVGDSSPSWA